MVEFKKGDLFNDGFFDIYVITTNCVGVAGAGVALQCKQKYPQWYKEYRKQCFDALYFPGHIYEFQLDSAITIINFTTKDHWRSDSCYPWIKSGLNELRKLLEKSPWRKRIAVPALGCKNGKLSWATVKPIITSNLKDLDHDIIVFEPW